jgi:hypothetical protein
MAAEQQSMFVLMVIWCLPASVSPVMLIPETSPFHRNPI